jgi:hypothetical protein
MLSLSRIWTSGEKDRPDSYKNSEDTAVVIGIGCLIISTCAAIERVSDRLGPPFRDRLCRWAAVPCEYIFK